MNYHGRLLPVTLALYIASYSQTGKHEIPIMFSQAKKESVSIARSLFFITNHATWALFKEKISIDLKQATLNEILREFGRQTNRPFTASQEVLSLSTKTDIHLKNASITEFLDFINDKFCVWAREKKDIIIISPKTCFSQITCRVIDSAQNPVKKYIVYVKGRAKQLTCDKNGFINIYNVSTIDSLVVDADGYKILTIPVNAENMTILLGEKAGSLEPHEVTHNGIKEEPVATSTGSYLKANMNNFESRSQTTNIMTRMQITGGIPFPINYANTSDITAESPRGTNSFFNRRADYVVNGHVQMVSSNSWNPFDIQNVWQVKDADGTSLWGVASSNTINNFELKKGITGGCDINVLSSLTITNKPGLHYQHTLNAAQRIDLEQQAFRKQEPMAWSPVTDRLSKLTDPAAIDQEVMNILQEWSKNDLKNDLQNTAYQYGALQQYGLSIQTGNDNVQLYASACIDDNKALEMGNRWRRITGLVNSTFQSGKWEGQLTANLSQIKEWRNFVTIPTTLPYQTLFNADGSPKALLLRPAFNGPNFLNTNFTYQNEAALANHTITQSYQSYTAKLEYKLPFHLKATANYQLSHINYRDENQQALAGYNTSSLLNDFRQNDNGNISWPIPIGDITDKVWTETYIHSLRSQIDFLKKIGKFRVSSLLGTELRSYKNNGHVNKTYASNLSFYPTPINYNNVYDLNSSPGLRTRIPYINNAIDSADNLLGYFASGTISYLDRYSFSLNTRKDFMNRFSRDHNTKGVGLWSAGASWYLSREDFFTWRNILKDLKLRFTVGRNGNVDYSIPPFHSIQSAVNQGQVYNYAIPSTQQVTWEKLLMVNAGVDFTTPVLTGSIDVYQKKGWDLLQYQAWNPTTGAAQVKSNSGSLKGSGIELNLQAESITLAGDLKFSASLLMACTRNKVTSTDGIRRPAQDYINSDAYVPRKGYATDAVFAYTYGGLSDKGKPRGFFNKGLSEAYDSIFMAQDGSTITYMGSAIPAMVTNFMPSFSYQSFTLSFRFIMKSGYAVRTPALNYFRLLQQTGGDGPGYELRWQNPGDESRTDIPALLFPLNINALQFYEGSTVHVINGSHIRWQDIQLAYRVNTQKHKKFPFKKLEAYLTANNISILWRANKKGYDPDVPVGGYPQPRSLAITLKFTY